MGGDRLNIKKFLYFIPFQKLQNWSVQFLTGTKIEFTAAYPMVRIGDFLSRNRNLIKIEDKKEYVRVRIKTHNGGVERREKNNVLGENIGTKKQCVISEGQFIVSKIDARNGAMGIVPKELDGAIVTQDFLSYNIDTNIINPQYFVLVSTTKSFVDFCQSCSSGTTNRQRINIDAFLSQQIPLPTLEDQNKFVTTFFSSMMQSDQLIQQAYSIKKQINVFLQDKLGMNTPIRPIEKSPKALLSFVNYSNIQKWGFEFVTENYNSLVSASYPYKKLSHLCNISSGGTPSRGSEHFYGGDIPWVKTGELKDEILTDTEEKLTQLGLNNSSAKIYPKGSLIIAMYGATIGKTAKLGVDAATNQACAVLFNIDSKQILTDYLWLYLQSQSDNFKSMAYGGAQPNINAGIISNYDIPLPPINVQKEIVEHINNQIGIIRQLREQSHSIREKAKQEFEAKIFN